MNQYKIEVSNQGTIRWCNLQNNLHRLDGPAVEWYNGTKEWWVDGKQHRLDGPAVEWSDGGKEWWVNGKLHRLDGPAVEWSDGGKEWYVDGKLHRLDGPVVEWSDGDKFWYVNGKLHRIEDGPAIERKYGTNEWWVDGVKYDEQTFNREFKIKTSCMSGLCMWVSVSDEMPEEQDVNKAGCKYYHLKIKNFNNGIGFYANGVWRKDYVSIYDVEVTHWLKEF